MNIICHFVNRAKHCCSTGRLSNFVFRRCYSAESYVGRHLEEVVNNYEDIVFMPLRVKQWKLGECFSRANIETVQYLRDETGIREPNSVSEKEIMSGKVKTHLIPFKSIFNNGFKALQGLVDGHPLQLEGFKDDYHVNDNLLLQFATNAFLAGFLCDKEYHEECLQKIRETDNEEEICVIMANHLFSRLTANTGQTYFVANTKNRQKECSCSLRCGDEIIYDNIGFGSELLWFGKPDIMVFPMGGVSCSIVMPKKCDDLTDSEPDEEEDLFFHHVNDLFLREEYNKRQIISHCITFSLYQKIYQKKKKIGPFSKVNLIPVIAACGASFDIYLYDSKNDILLRNCGPPIPLWDETKLYGRLNLSSVIKLWMVINHASVCPSLSEDDVNMLKESCGFISKFSCEDLTEIESTLEMKQRFYPIKYDKEFDFNYLPSGVKVTYY